MAERWYERKLQDSDDRVVEACDDELIIRVAIDLAERRDVWLRKWILQPFVRGAEYVVGEHGDDGG